PFYIVANIPNDEITKGGLQILKKFSFIAIIILIISFLIAYVISDSITKRINQLIDVMANVENSKFSVQVPVVYNDEISVLKRNFNWMVERIRNLIDAVYKSNIEKKEAELKLLQAQINPHFLYNTLDSINWLAVRTDASEISYIVKNLSDYLRIGLNKGEDMTSIENEIKHIYAYFNIQKFRFEDKINLEVNITSEILNHKTITLVLQPLVENAILHGILKEEGRKGVITITAEEIEGMIILEVKDNGIGIEKDTLLKILENMNNFTNADMGYGLRNVHQRIRYKFGEEYGLNIISEKDKGTSCLLIFPAI
ncbi:MAG: sensor histidine kinase, partial [Clostridiaceae bacterium]|nr:sensor histidine kinase [Clostridiaceae bacterium]